ncbi:MAG: anthranilate phosphoribosyltransferase [Bacteroidota bacterium]
MKALLERLFHHETLTKEEARDVLTRISREEYNPSQVASFITVFLMRSLTVAELSGFREALLDLCVSVDIGGIESIDVCGTGGDGKNTFNISTLSSFVIAGAGYKVTKHGNYGVSSVSGSSNVLESLGYRFTNDQEALARQLDKAGICFYHAPLFHPALKSVGPIRKNLGIKTFFNMLGPLVNPAQPTHQMTGVYNLTVFRLYRYLFEDLGHRFAIVHGFEGFDEISLTDQTKLYSSNRGEDVVSSTTFGMPRYDVAQISGGDSIEDAAKIFLHVLEGTATQAQTDVVLANSALAIDCFKSDSDLHASLHEARESLSSGRALEVLKTVVELSK